MQIDPEFKKIADARIGKHEIVWSQDEVVMERLEKDISEHGLINPILTWKGIIIDGHKRYEICQKLGITDIPEKEIYFSNRNVALKGCELIHHGTIDGRFRDDIPSCDERGFLFEAIHLYDHIETYHADRPGINATKRFTDAAENYLACTRVEEWRIQDERRRRNERSNKNR